VVVVLFFALFAQNIEILRERKHPQKKTRGFVKEKTHSYKYFWNGKKNCTFS
jgi:hypothetical protein